MGEEYVLVCMSDEKYVEFPAGKQMEILLNEFESKIVAGFLMINSLGNTGKYTFMDKTTFYEKGLNKKYYNATADVLAYLFEEDCIDINKLSVFLAGWVYKVFEEAKMLDELRELAQRKGKRRD